MSSARHTIVAIVLIALNLGQAHAQTHLLEQLDVAASQYHKDPAQLDRLRADLESAVAADPHPTNWIGLARISFLWGDIRAATKEQKLEAYERGRHAGKRAIELAPRDAKARFWYATNTGRWGQTNGVVRSLFLLPTVREELATTLALDPNFTGAYVVMGYVYYEVPARTWRRPRQGRGELSYRPQPDPYLHHGASGPGQNPC